MKSKPWLQGLILNLVLTLGVLGTNTLLWARQAEPGLTLTLKVYNYTPTTEDILIQTEKEVRKIFQKVGADIVWIDVPVPSQEKKAVTVDTQRLQPPFHQLSIFILTRSMAERLGRSQDTLGYAAPALEGRPANVAYIFFHRINKLVEDLLRTRSVGMPNTAQILAFAIAHEIGHLVLPFDPDSLHSPTGIMRASWDHQDLRRLARGLLLFTPEQGRLMRRGLMSR